MIRSSLLFAASCLAVAQGTLPASARTNHSEIGEFVGPQGRIRIDTGRLTITVGDIAHPLADCSNGEFRCFKSEALGFHVVFVRSCAHRARIEGEVLGGALFNQFAFVEHGDSRQGRYSSELSDRFAYAYFLDRGLAEVQYDPTGVARFGPRHFPVRGHGYDAWQPFTYRLVSGRSFLRCQR